MVDPLMRRVSGETGGKGRCETVDSPSDEEDSTGEAGGETDVADDDDDDDDLSEDGVVPEEDEDRCMMSLGDILDLKSLSKLAIAVEDAGCSTKNVSNDEWCSRVPGQKKVVRAGAGDDEGSVRVGGSERRRTRLKHE